VAHSFKNKLPGGPILYQKEIGMILKKDIIIGSKAINRNKILSSLRSMTTSLARIESAMATMLRRGVETPVAPIYTVA
jgi:hypothetical protein